MTQKPFEAQLGIISCVNAFRDAEGHLWCNHAMGRLLDTLRQFVPGARLCLPVLPTGHRSMGHRIQFEPHEVTDLPPLQTVMKSQRHFLETRRIVRRFSEQCDLLFMRVPFQVPMALRNLGKPKLMHVISNPHEVISVSSDYKGLMRMLAVRFAAHSNATMRRMAAEPMTRVASNGQEMWDVLRPRAGRVVVSSCIYAREMRPRRQGQWPEHRVPARKQAGPLPTLSTVYSRLRRNSRHYRGSAGAGGLSPQSVLACVVD
ncbi:MAG: hypothetical protein WCL32_24780, partial [Planctomycetota bacterium]